MPEFMNELTSLLCGNCHSLGELSHGKKGCRRNVALPENCRSKIWTVRNMENQTGEQGELILAAEECPDELFNKLHYFSKYEERIIISLIAHGPVLIRGGRGSGKSALMRKAYLRILSGNSKVLGIYSSLRNLPLLRSEGADYEKIFCDLLIANIRKELEKENILSFFPSPNAGSVQQTLVELSTLLGKRIVLFFDDAAHIGREASLKEFFDIFRTLSSVSISCKAAIYPGVTQFGTRFDIFNDATVIDISRDEGSQFFASFFLEVIKLRYPDILDRERIARTLREESLAEFLGRAVVGNMRSLIFLCNRIRLEDQRVGLKELGKSLIYLSGDYYWPLLEELSPKLGHYEPLIEVARNLAEKIFDFAKRKETVSVVIHRDLVQKLLKPIEILEYAGFVSRREMSRAMKSGGRGSRFTLNLCNLLEITYGKRLTSERFQDWLKENGEPSEIHSSSDLLNVEIPDMMPDKELSILSMKTDSLVKSKSYPYGLTQAEINVLRESGIHTIGELAEMQDDELLRLRGIGEKFLKRIRDVVGQAIWM